MRVEIIDEQINIVIASLQGWTKINEVDRGFGVHPHWLTATDYLGRPIESPPIWEIPEYTKSLDAMHEVVMTLSEDQEDAFTHELLKMVAYHQPYRDGEQCFADYFKVANATARQRAEAYLKTVEKWEE